MVDLGANHGLFSVWAAVSGAQAVAVEAQHGFASEIRSLAIHNGVAERVHVEIALASGVTSSGAAVGALADDHRWGTSSHTVGGRPDDISMPEVMREYGIPRIGLLKMDIEGGEFAVLADREDLSWLQRVDQLALELHRGFGDTEALIDRLRRHGFTIDLRDNDGGWVTSRSDHPDYAYCRRA